MVSGRPFQRDTSVATMAAILDNEPPELIAARPDLSPALARIIHRCLEKQPDNRFQSAKDLAFALESLTGSTVPAQAHPSPRAGAPNVLAEAPQPGSRGFWELPLARAPGLAAVGPRELRDSGAPSVTAPSRLHVPIATPPDERLIPYYARWWQSLRFDPCGVHTRGHERDTPLVDPIVGRSASRHAGEYGERHCAFFSARWQIHRLLFG